MNICTFESESFISKQTYIYISIRYNLYQTDNTIQNDLKRYFCFQFVSIGMKFVSLFRKVKLTKH